MSWNRQTTDWEEIFSEHLLAKCWCPEYVKGRQLIIKGQTLQLKMDKRFEHFA